MNAWLLMAIISISFLVGAGFVAVALSVLLYSVMFRVKRNNDDLAETLTSEDISDLFHLIGGDDMEK